MPIKKLRPSYAFDEERLDELRAVVPEAFADGKINWDVLKESLGEYLEDEDAEAEHFGLFWPGKREARRLASRPSKGTLVPEPDLGLDERATQNIFIEGENLEVLKVLQKSYAGRLKLIYIDPPYNTGNDFIYSDDYSEPLATYLQRTEQANEAGEILTTNPRTSGRFHSNWLNMMYPRLRLARQLMDEDGVILISIDDNEIHNLLALVKEIWGEENVIGVLVWEKKKKGAFLASHLTNIKEYVIVAARDASEFEGLIGEIATNTETYPCINASNSREIRRIPAGIPSNYSEENYTLPEGSIISSGTMNMVLHSDLIIEDDTLKVPLLIEGRWRYTQEKIDEFARNGHLYLTTDLYLRRIVTEPRYKRLKDLLPRVGTNPDADYRDYNPDNLFADGWGSNEDGEEEVRTIFGEQDVYSYPKPMKLIAKLIASYRDKNAIVMDFFAGSCTTAHAVLDLNHKDNGNRRFIMIQIPEPTDNPEYSTITEIGRDRLSRVITQMKVMRKGELDLYPNEDLGFRYYRLEHSNYKEWQDYEGDDVGQIATLFDQFESPLIEDWKSEDLLTEILLLEGFPLESQVVNQESFTHNQVQIVTSDSLQHRLFVCLDETIASETIAQLELEDKDVFVCLDTALTDQTKVRLADAGNIHVI